MFLSKVLLTLAAASTAFAGILLPIGEESPAELPRRQATSTTSSTATTSSLVADSKCTHGPQTRQCWGNGYSIATNYDAEWPVTGKTVKYTIDITNGTGAPDGYERIVFGINGKMPGPTLFANWGDILEITVNNKLEDNGTSIHWHGLRQWKTSHMDGTNGITECPLAPRDSRTYRFLCTQFGTTWFHSHYSAQYSDGVIGTIIINGPATANYDIDLGTMTVQDWYYKTAYQNAILSRTSSRGPPAAQNGLINGTMVSSFGGHYHRTNITKGKRYRLRLINTSTDSHFKVSLDNHNFTVITADFVPVKPYSAQWVFLGIGERHDVIINANQDIGSYWFRAVVMQGCGNNENNNNIKSIFSYDNAASLDPLSQPWPMVNECVDEKNLVPYVKLNVPRQIIPQSSFLNVSLSRVQTTGNQTLVQWNLNVSAIQVDWEKPTLQYVLDGNTSYPKGLNLIELPNQNAWAIWVIQQVGLAAGVPHPIHLHGHDFYVLGTGPGVFNNPDALNYNNPPRRDVAMLPGGGWMVMAFITDNPGAWLMHCHIAWHVGEGLGAQFLERKADIPSTLNIDAGWSDQCRKWTNWYDNEAYWKMDDSGL